MFGVLLCFLLSGFAALLYQTAWLRQLSLVFGTSELAVATVLASYMAGLALGASVAGRLAPRIRRPIWVYGLLELGIAVSALAVPTLMGWASAGYVAVLGGQATPPDAAHLGQPLFYLAVSIAILAIPTSLMGATLPLLTRYAVSTDRELGSRIAALYATNTAGAVLGTLCTGFVLLPALGIGRTVWVGAFVNALVFVLAAGLARASDTTVSERTAPNPQPKRLHWILPAMLVSGSVSFSFEVVWTRLLTHVLGGGIYAFATMLATFLAGIALGGGLAGRFARTRESACHAFVVAQLGIALLSMAVYSWMGPLLPESGSFSGHILLSMAVMFPATVFIGATFPLAVRILARDESEASVSTARIYSWNTVGAIVGAVATGFWLLPQLGFSGTVKGAVCTSTALALIALLASAPAQRVRAGVVVLGLLAIAVFYQPARPAAVFASIRILPERFAEVRETFYAVGRSATVLVVDDGGAHWILSNGLAEAAIASRGAAPARDAQTWLTALSSVARPEARDLLVVGLGGGSALAGVPHSVESIQVIELEPEVVRANRSLQALRAYDPLSDPRVQIIQNDARNALRLSDRRYDAIVSQPSHPWTAGASHLFTQEFLRIAKSHLNEDGVFVQWMGSGFLSDPLLRSLAATLLAEFSNVRLYRPTLDDLLFLASDGALDLERDWVRSGRPRPEERSHYQRLGIGSAEDLIAALVANRQGLAALSEGAPLITDDRNWMATHSQGSGGLSGAQVDALFAPHDPLLDPESFIHRELRDSLNLPHLMRSLIRMNKRPRARTLTQILPESSGRSLAIAELQADAGNARQATHWAKTSLDAEPGNDQARYFLSRERMGPGGARSAQPVSGEFSGSAAATNLGWQFVRERDWSALANQDEALAESRVTDLWYPDAALLRARWRILSGLEPRRATGEALAVLDDALLFARDFRLHLERLRVSLASGDPDLLVESSRAVVQIFRDQVGVNSDAVQLAPSIQSMMVSNLGAISGALERDFPPALRHRARLIHAAADDLLQRLGPAARKRPARGARP